MKSAKRWDSPTALEQIANYEGYGSKGKVWRHLSMEKLVGLCRRGILQN